MTTIRTKKEIIYGNDNRIFWSFWYSTFYTWNVQWHIPNNWVKTVCNTDKSRIDISNVRSLYGVIINR